MSIGSLQDYFAEQGTDARDKKESEGNFHSDNQQIKGQSAIQYATNTDKVASMFWEGFEKKARELTTKARKALSSGEFVFPKERRYPIHDEAHGRAALQRVSQFGSPSEKAKVRAAVHSKYPDIGKE